MTQKEQVIEVMKKNKGVATLGQLYQMLDFSTWKTKTPQATVRQIVQINKEFFKIKPGVWGLAECENKVRKMLGIDVNNTFKNKSSQHDYYQGTIVTIGNIRDYKTFVPSQDKNKLYLGKKIGDIVSLNTLGNFSYDNIVRKARTVDIIWINERKMPNAFFEIENTTNFTDSLNKFYELQDFHAVFNIVAPKERKKEFDSKISMSLYKDIEKRVNYLSYEDIDKQFSYDKDKINIF